MLKVSNTIEENKRILIRRLIKVKNEKINYLAKYKGISNLGKFYNYGYMGLYNEEIVSDITKRKNINKNECILDYMTSYELMLNLFRLNLTEAILRLEEDNASQKACQVHYVIGKEIRNMLKILTLTLPEDIKTPSKIKTNYHDPLR